MSHTFIAGITVSFFTRTRPICETIGSFSMIEPRSSQSLSCALYLRISFVLPSDECFVASLKHHSTANRWKLETKHPLSFTMRHRLAFVSLVIGLGLVDAQSACIPLTSNFPSCAVSVTWLELSFLGRKTHFGLVYLHSVCRFGDWMHEIGRRCL